MILGYHSSSFSLGNDWRLLYILFLGTCLFGAVFLINQIYDIESDRINKKLHFLPEGHIKTGIAWIMIMTLNSIALILSFSLSFQIVLVALLVIILGILYSVPPIFLKNRAWPAAFANGLGNGTLVFILGFLAGGGSMMTGILKSLPYFFAVMSVYIGTTLPDTWGDAEQGKNTIAVVYNLPVVHYLIICSFLISIIAGIIINDTPFLIAAFAALPFYIWSFFKKSINAVILAVKISIITLTLAASYMMPLYLVFVVFLVFATRAYYKARFGIEYPSLK